MTSLHCDGRSSDASHSQPSQKFEPGRLDPRLTSITLIYFSGFDIGPVSFRGLSQLQHLNLSGNDLRNINSQDIVGLSNLEIIDLSNNHLTFLDEFSFPPFGRMTYIDVRRNQDSLLEIDDYTFRAALGYCRPCDIEELEEFLNGSVPTTRTLLVDDNTCTVQYQQGMSSGNSLQLCERVVCKEPAQTAEDLTCRGSESTSYAPGSICDGIEQCDDAEDETSLCDTVPVFVQADEGNANVCDLVEINFGTSPLWLQGRSGLLVMTHAEEDWQDSQSFLAPELFIWRRENLTRASYAFVTHNDFAIAALSFNLTIFHKKIEAVASVTTRNPPLHADRCHFTFDVRGYVSTTVEPLSSPAADISTNSAPNDAVRTGAVAGAVALVMILLTATLLCRQRSRTLRLLDALDDILTKTPSSILSAVRFGDL